MTERIALLADLHSNLEAFEACMAHARYLGATRYVFLGDIVGYNADPCALIDRVAGMVRAGQAQAVLGNHDQALFVDHSEKMNPDALAAVNWTREQVSSAQMEFLRGLPLVINEDDICFVHASAHNPDRWNYVSDDMGAWKCAEASGKTYTFVGHVHEPQLFYQTEIGKLRRFEPHPGRDVPVSRLRRWVSVVGSMGQPRDGNPDACMALFEPNSELITFHRVPYDYFTAAEKVRDAGLPESLANRLITGH